MSSLGDPLSVLRPYSRGAAHAGFDAEAGLEFGHDGRGEPFNRAHGIAEELAGDRHLDLDVVVDGRQLAQKLLGVRPDMAVVNHFTVLSDSNTFQASGIRLGTPAATTRGMREKEMAAIADMISEVLLDIKNLDAARKVRQRVCELTAGFPLPY